MDDDAEAVLAVMRAVLGYLATDDDELTTEIQSVEFEVLMRGLSQRGLAMLVALAVTTVTFAEQMGKEAGDGDAPPAAPPHVP